MNAMIRGCMTALSLTFGAIQWANAARYDTPQKPTESRHLPQDAPATQTARAFEIQPSIGASDPVGAGSRAMPTAMRPLQSGNDFNFIGGGGG